MNNNSNNPEFTQLNEQLSAIDEKTIEAIKFTDNNIEEIYTKVAMNFLKLEVIDVFIYNNCIDGTVLKAFEMFSSTAMDSMQMLQTILNDEE